MTSVRKKKNNPTISKVLVEFNIVKRNQMFYVKEFLDFGGNFPGFWRRKVYEKQIDFGWPWVRESKSEDITVLGRRERYLGLLPNQK